MAKANLVLPDGTTVEIEGGAEEVALLLERLGSQKPSRRTGRKRRAAEGSSQARRRSARGPTDYIRELKQDDFFSAKRTIGDIQSKLQEGAHLYSQRHLSKPLYRLVASRELRRMKEDGVWKYVNP